MSLSRFAVLLAGAADSLTFVLMGTAHEANPLVVAAPSLALAAKVALTVVVAFWPWPYALLVRAVGVIGWTYGAYTNSLWLLS